MTKKELRASIKLQLNSYLETTPGVENALDWIHFAQVSMEHILPGTTSFQHMKREVLTELYNEYNTLKRKEKIKILLKEL